MTAERRTERSADADASSSVASERRRASTNNEDIDEVQLQLLDNCRSSTKARVEYEEALKPRDEIFRIAPESVPLRRF